MIEEFGVLVNVDEPNKLVIHWRVSMKHIASTDNPPVDWASGWKKGDTIYHTSLGWQAANKDGSNYFEKSSRERDIRPCLRRAEDYAKKMWPGWRGETH